MVLVVLWSFWENVCCVVLVGLVERSPGVNSSILESKASGKSSIECTRKIGAKTFRHKPPLRKTKKKAVNKPKKKPSKT